MTEPSETRPEPKRAVIRDKRRISPTGGGAHRAQDSAGPASARSGGPAPTSGGGTPPEGGGPAEEVKRGPDAAAETAASGGPAGGDRAGASGAGAGGAGDSGAGSGGAAGRTGGRRGAEAPSGTPEPSGQPTGTGEPEPGRTPKPAGAASAEATQAEGQEPAGPAGPEAGAAGGLGAELEALRAALDERTRDLQRVTAEYANYRKRVERDRALIGEQATGNVLSALLPVLDDLDRAREHGELVEGFAAVAEQLLAALTKFGLTAFGEKGDPFDPNRHEAVAHLTSDEVDGPTCVDILRRGYLLGDRLLRPAMVAVAEPSGDES